MVNVVNRFKSIRLLHLALLASVIYLNAGLIDNSFAQEMDKDQRIEELEEKLKKVTDEVEKLKSQSINQDNMSSIEEKLNILAEEIEKLKSPELSEEPVYEKKYGRAEGASKVYLTDKKGISIGGYGELLLGQIRDDDNNNVDTQRAVLYFGYRLTDHIIFNSEIEFEHATTEDNLDGSDGSVSVEFASIDFLMRDEFNVRAGLLLAPFGIINEFHEPTTFFGALRPDVERNIIPTTWRENGIGIFGETENLIPGVISYRLYAMNSFDSRGFKASDNRGLRTRGNRSRLNDVAFVGRLEYEPHPLITIGSSVFLGNTGQNEDFEGENIDGFLQMYEGDVQFQYKGFGLKGLIVYTLLDDADLINQNNELVGDESVGEEQYGWYLEGSYNVLTSFDIHPYFRYLAPFIRYEQYDTQHEVPSGFQRDPNNDRSLYTVGFSYKPINNVVFKVDYQFRDNEGDGANDQLNFGLGYVF